MFRKRGGSKRRINYRPQRVVPLRARNFEPVVTRYLRGAVELFTDGNGNVSIVSAMSDNTNFGIGGIPEYASMKALYRQLRVEQLRVCVIPQQTISLSTTATTANPCYLAITHGDCTTSSGSLSLSTMLGMPSTRYMSLAATDRQLTCKWYRNPDNTQEDWFDMDSASFYHGECGDVVLWCDTNLAAGVRLGTAIYTYKVIYKSPRYIH